MSKEVLERIDRRLKKVGMKEAPAAVKAGLSDSAIRNVRRALRDGKDAKFSMRTLEALAPILQTTVAWLAEENGPEEPEPTTPEERELLRDFRALDEETQRAVRTIVKRPSGNAAPDDDK